MTTDLVTARVLASVLLNRVAEPVVGCMRGIHNWKVLIAWPSRAGKRVLEGNMCNSVFLLLVLVSLLSLGSVLLHHWLAI